MVSGGTARLRQDANFGPARFVCIHRSTIVAMKYIRYLQPMFSGRMCVRLNDQIGTELDVTRNRVQILKQRMGIK